MQHETIAYEWLALGAVSKMYHYTEWEQYWYNILETGGAIVRFNGMTWLVLIDQDCGVEAHLVNEIK